MTQVPVVETFCASWQRKAALSHSTGARIDAADEYLPLRVTTRVIETLASQRLRALRSAGYALEADARVRTSGGLSVLHQARIL